MGIKLYDSELKVMEILWKEGELTAGHIAKILKEEIGWNRNTTYTVIKKCIEKGAVERSGSAGTGFDHWEFACTNPCSGCTGI